MASLSVCQCFHDDDPCGETHCPFCKLPLPSYDSAVGGGDRLLCRAEEDEEVALAPPPAAVKKEVVVTPVPAPAPALSARAQRAAARTEKKAPAPAPVPPPAAPPHPYQEPIVFIREKLVEQAAAVGKEAQVAVVHEIFSYLVTQPVFLAAHKGFREIVVKKARQFWTEPAAAKSRPIFSRLSEMVQYELPLLPQWVA